MKANLLVVMNHLTYEFTDDEYGLIGCSLCWRAGCAAWEARDIEAEVHDGSCSHSVTDAGDVEDFGELVLADAYSPALLE